MSLMILNYRKIEDILEESYYQDNNSGTWDDYINNLPDICTGFGYSGLNSVSLGFIHVNTDADTATVDDDRFIDVNVTSSSSSTNNLSLPI